MNLQKREDKKAEEHEGPNNFEGSSKSMEASDILKMAEDALYNRSFIIDVIVSDDDSKMQAVLKHHLIGVRGQVLKTSKGKLDEEIPEPSFLADTSHLVKFQSDSQSPTDLESNQSQNIGNARTKCIYVHEIPI